MKFSFLNLFKLKKNAEELKLIDNYLKRITDWKIELIETNNKIPKNPNHNIADQLINRLEKFDKIIILDVKGKSLSTNDFKQEIQNWQLAGASKVAIIIGGAFGIKNYDILKKKADLIISLGYFTWPHRLVLLMMIEQIYRIHSIINNHPYHK